MGVDPQTRSWPWQPVYEADWLGEGGGPAAWSGDSPGQSAESRLWQWWWGCGGRIKPAPVGAQSGHESGKWLALEGLVAHGAVDPGLKVWPPLRACKKLPKLPKHWQYCS